MALRPQETFNDIVNAGTAHISDFARERLLIKTENNGDGAFESSFHDENAVRDNGRKRNRNDDAYQQMAMQATLNANVDLIELYNNVVDFVNARLNQAQENLEQAQAQDEEMQTALTADTDESLSSHDFKEQLENAPEGDFELTQTQMNMLQTALDKPNLQANDEQREAMQRSMESGVILAEDMDMVTGGVEAYSMLEAMEAFGTMEAAATTNYNVSRAERDVNSLQEFQTYLESEEIQQQIENGEITEEELLAEMPQHVRDAYEAEHGPLLAGNTNTDEAAMTISEGTRATAGTDAYMDDEPNPLREGAPPMASHFGAAHAGVPAQKAPDISTGPTPEETAAHRAQLGAFSL